MDTVTIDRSDTRPTVELEGCPGCGSVDTGRFLADHTRCIDCEDSDPGGIAVVTGSAVVDANRFRATLAAVAGFAGKNDARPILTGVRVEFHPGPADCENDPDTGNDGHLLMVATDSYRLAVFPVPAVVTGNPEPALFGRDTVAAILALVKPGIIGRTPNPVTLQLSDPVKRTGEMTEPAGFRFENGAGAQTTGASIGGEYPNYRGLIPEFNPSGGAVAFNPGYLEATGKAFRVLLAGSGAPVRVSTDPHTADHPALPGGLSGRPVLFTVEDSDLWPDPCPNPAAILMPVRIK